MERCAVKGCRSNDIGITYLGKLLCNRCWNKLSEKPVNALRAALGLKPQEIKLEVVEIPKVEKIPKAMPIVHVPMPAKKKSDTVYMTEPEYDEFKADQAKLGGHSEFVPETRAFMIRMGVVGRLKGSMVMVLKGVRVTEPKEKVDVEVDTAV